MYADARSVRSENEVGFENEGECGGGGGGGIKEFFIILRLLFPPRLLQCSSPILRALQQNRVQHGEGL